MLVSVNGTQQGKSPAEALSLAKTPQPLEQRPNSASKRANSTLTPPTNTPKRPKVKKNRPPTAPFDGPNTSRAAKAAESADQEVGQGPLSGMMFEKPPPISGLAMQQQPLQQQPHSHQHPHLDPHQMPTNQTAYGGYEGREQLVKKEKADDNSIASAVTTVAGIMWRWIDSILVR
ncbi:GD17718 [Drosophila simulans]|uniref:GD17718 n=1 Tax=Drosophila simulans TaxID=7240 RepID=B4NSV1_DROSI|nr:GD17718 [Drosophila simulans]